MALAALGQVIAFGRARQYRFKPAGVFWRLLRVKMEGNGWLA